LKRSVVEVRECGAWRREEEEKHEEREKGKVFSNGGVRTRGDWWVPSKAAGAKDPHKRTIFLSVKIDGNLSI
jgi:hypothetical protein